MLTHLKGLAILAACFAVLAVDLLLFFSGRGMDVIVVTGVFFVLVFVAAIVIAVIE